MGHYPGGSLVWEVPQVHNLVFDEEIGAVEIKDGVSDDRANVIDILGVKRLAVDAVLSASIADVGIDANIQVPTVDRALAALAPGTVSLAAHDCLNYGAIGISVHVERDVADASVDIVLEESVDNVTWREVDRQSMSVAAASPAAELARVYSLVRRYARVTLVNTVSIKVEVAVLLKPVL